MCQTYPGLRCPSHINRTRFRAAEEYARNPSPATETAYLLAEHEYSLIPHGFKALLASDDILGTLRALDERNERLATAKRFREWAKTVSSEEATAAGRRLRKFSPWTLIGVEEQWQGLNELKPQGGPNIQKAYTVAVKAHAGVKRKNNSPYINHPLRVYDRLAKHCRHPLDEETLMVALLHDAVEDSSLTLNDLRLMGFSERVVAGVDSVTKRPGESYPDAVCRASRNRDGRWVKISDNLDNSSPEELRVFDDPKRRKQMRKYYPAIHFLRQTILLTVSKAS